MTETNETNIQAEEQAKAEKDTRQTNFRIKPADAEAFRTFCKEHGLGQAEGFNFLVKQMELVNAKAALPDRDTEIAAYQNIMNEAVSMFTASLQREADVRDRCRAEFAQDIESRDATIKDLQEQKKELKAKLDETKQAAKDAEDAARTAKEAADAAVDAAVKEKKAAEAIANEAKDAKESLKSQLTDSERHVAELEGMQAGYDAIAAEKAELMAEISRLNQDALDAARMAEKDKADAIAAMQKKLDDAAHKAEVDAEKAARAADQAKAQAVSEAQAAMQNTIDSLREELSAAQRSADAEHAKAEIEAEKAAHKVEMECQKTIIQLRERIAVLEASK